MMSMDDKEILLDIENLKVNFYTYQGVVKALDGVNLTIRQAETVGLVGETGCGKSVTASSITKLIPCPPGKIEQGNVYFMEPSNVRAKRKEYQEKAVKWYELLSERDRKKMTAQYEPNPVEFKKKKLKEKEIEQIKPVEHPPAKLVTKYLASIAKKSPKTDSILQEALMQKFDLLQKSDSFMQQIRGRYISMIFQEPTAALNPVFTAGDQIAEVILLHRKADLAKQIRKRYDKELELVKKGDRPHIVRRGTIKCPDCGMEVEASAELKCPACGNVKFKKKKGDQQIDIFECSICHSEARKTDAWCSSCGNEFHDILSWKFRRYVLNYYHQIFKIIEVNPKSKRIATLSKIPIIKRFNKELYKEAIREAVKMLTTVRIPDPKGISDRYPHELSGGMQQRVMIAIALACNPRLLIADEPTTALDVTIQAQILKLMRELKRLYGSSILLITHNLGVVAEMCDRVGVMYAGTIAEIASARIIFKSPMHPYTIGLMQAVPSIQAESEKLFTIRGSVPNLIFPPTGCRFHPRCDYARKYCEEVKPELFEIEEDHFVACHKVAGAKGYE